MGDSPHPKMSQIIPPPVYFYNVSYCYFVLVAPNNYDANSFIWKFNEKKKRFFEFQKIATIGAWDWTYFSSSSQSGEVYHFLVVANTLNNKREVKLDSKLYIWNKERQTGLGNFVFYQSFAVSLYLVGISLSGFVAYRK